VKIAYIQHVPVEGPGAVADWAAARGHSCNPIKPYRSDCRYPDLADFDLLVVLGGPMSVHDEGLYPWLVPEKRFLDQALEARKKIFGICLGAQLIASVLGGQVRKNPERELGWFPIELLAEAAGCASLNWLPNQLQVFHWHGETFDIPAGCKHLARSEACRNQIFAFDDHVLGLQCHFEVTPEGIRAMHDSCPDEFAPGTFVQSFENIMERREYFGAANQILYGILDRFV
jgi:GMP synthase-like glutamine amidotransferase